MSGSSKSNGPDGGSSRSSRAKSRLSQLAAHFLPSHPTSHPVHEKMEVTANGTTFAHRYNIHTLSPTYWLPRAAEIEPDAVAVYHLTANGKILRRNYQELADRARGLAYYLKKKGFKQVGILCPNTPAFLEAIFGVAAAGAIHVAVNYRLKKDDISYIFQHADVDVIIVDQEFIHLLDAFKEAMPDIPFIVDTDTDQDEGPYDEAVLEGFQYDRELGGAEWMDLEHHAPDENGLISLAYTSGTTARPKGVEYTHRGVYLGAVANVIECSLSYANGRCRYLWTLPMFHAGGWTFPWAVTAVRGTHYCLRKINYSEIWRLLKEEEITHYNAAPTVNILLCNSKDAQRLSHPVRVTVAASPPTAHLFEMMTSLNLHPVHVYGMTETYGPITKCYPMPAWENIPPKEKYQKLARQGHGFVTSLPVRVIKTGLPDNEIVDVARDGKEVGEVVFIGNICARGYYKDPEATRKAFSGGFLHSGDLAIWHPDGAIQIVDRAKDVIISGGENISSVALESMLVVHPDILEVGVVAVSDEKWGERPKAYVTVKPGAKIEGKDIIVWAKNNGQISGFMVPREVDIVEDLPKTSTGKVRKNVLRDWAKGKKPAEQNGVPNGEKAAVQNGVK